MKIYKKCKLLIYISILLSVLLTSNIFAYTLSITEDMEKLPESELNALIDKQNEAAGQEQLKVAQQRFERRMQTKTEIADTLKMESLKRRQVIMQNKLQIEKREQSSENLSFAFSVILLGLFLFGSLYFVKTKYMKSKD